LEAHDVDNDRDREAGPIRVTGKTPAGFSNPFEIEPVWTINKVIDDMVTRFEAEGKLEKGDYNLVLVQPDGTSTQLIGSQKVSDYDIDNGAELDLIVGEPQKDG
jgi:hypothetical protein